LFCSWLNLKAIKGSNEGGVGVIYKYTTADGALRFIG
jgi:hypothetical protein